ncbi:hypothetical protein VTH06DRAFT_719 [Thermothelomyces fergusii]
MEYMTEFYLTTLWTYKPKVVRQVIDDMVGLGFTQAEFTYDSEYSWFKVTCRTDDADEIREQFGNIAREIEGEAFEACEDDLLNDDDTLKSSFDNEWFSQDVENVSSSESEQVDEMYCRPKPQAEYRFAEVWDVLDKNDESYTIKDILDRRQAKLVEDELELKLDARLNGKLVYIAGNSRESIREACERLEVMLAARRDATTSSSHGKGVVIKKDKVTQNSGSSKSSNPHGSQSFDSILSHPLPLDSKFGSYNHLLSSERFIKEIETAITKLLLLGPYRRGKLAVRAELGRIILEKVDRSGLAFNNASTPSNGWTKAQLLRNLNNDFGGSQNISFTKILSTYGCDVGDMVNLQVNGTRLWEEMPSRVWITYSFHCGLRSDKGLSRFIVDIEDCGAGSNQFSSSIRPSDGVEGADKPMPVYVHAICRHWDLRITMTHTKTDELEELYGAFAENLLRSLSVVRNEQGSLEVQFAVPAEAPTDVQAVRVLTKWRFPSVDRRSALEITEVLQLATDRYSEGPYSGAAWNTYEGKRSRPWSQKITRAKRDRGEVPRWYEAAVVSLELEDLCQQNAFLRIGEKAGWDAADVRNRGILPSLYSPALQMVRQMDHVGRLDDNHLSQQYGELLLQGNAPSPPVPGAAPVQIESRDGPRRCRRRNQGSTRSGSEVGSTKHSSRG